MKTRKRIHRPAVELGPGLPLTVEQAAHRLGVSIFTVRSWLRRGGIAYHRLGRRIVILEGDVQAFLAANRVEARDGAVAAHGR